MTRKNKIKYHELELNYKLTDIRKKVSIMMNR